MKKVLAVPAVAAAVLLTPGVASADDPVGTPGEPSCFGERVSHAASNHGLTPKERAAIFEERLPFLPDEARALFGDTVEVREIQWWVRTNCSDDPIVRPEPA